MPRCETRAASSPFSTARSLFTSTAFPDRPEEAEFDALRRTLCVAIGKLHGFLVDTLGEILAADPRSSHDVDYFLARRFPRDVEEAEWLLTSVFRLHAELQYINSERHESLGSVIDEMNRTGRLPSVVDWQQTGGLPRCARNRLRTQAPGHHRAPRHPNRRTRGPAGARERASRIVPAGRRALFHGG